MLIGYIDKAEGEVVGWAYDTENPEEKITLDIYVSGKFRQNIQVDQPRSDLASIGIKTVRHGFNVPAQDISPSDVIFARRGDEFIVQSPSALRNHLQNFLRHTALQTLLPQTTEYSGAFHPKDQVVAESVFNYVSQASLQSSDLGALWEELRASRHGELLALVERRDTGALGDYLSEVGRRRLAFGFLGGPDAHHAAQTNPLFRVAAATHIIDRLWSLAEAIGCVRVENPEQGTWGVEELHNPEFLMDRIAAALSPQASLAPPVGGCWGVSTRHGIFDVRALDSLNVAYRIKSLCRHHGLEIVTEIGGGAGLAAHYALVLGIQHYQIVDLPTVGAVQAYTLADHGVAYYDTLRGDAKATLIPTWAFSDQTVGHGDLLVNVDSLPEIETEGAVKYLTDAREKGYKFFLSINQESGSHVGEWSQNKVFDLAERAGGLTRLTRHRDWMRPGYIEELYRFS